MTGEIVWMRHGTCRDGEQRSAAHPHPDSPLSQRGRVEAELAADLLGADGLRPAHVIASPLPRAWATVTIIAAAWDIPLHLPEPTLVEWHPPDCVLGRTPDEYPPAYLRWRDTRHARPHTSLPGGESLTALTDRARAAHRRVTERRRGTGPLLVISHRVLIGAVAALVAGHRDPAAVFAHATAFTLPPTATWSTVHRVDDLRPEPTPRPAAPPG